MQTFSGIVIRSFGAQYRVRTPEGRELDCLLRGKFRLLDLNTTNPVAVGDRVHGGFEDAGAVINEIEPRTNALLRKSTRSGTEVQMLAANLDQALLVAPLKEPHTPLGYIDRFLVMCEAYGIPALLLLNKVDLLTKDRDLDKLNDYLSNYSKIGYTILPCSALDPDFPPLLAALLHNKTTFLAGLSGSGKSTLINTVAPELNLKTGTISKHTQKGRHTTTYAGLYELPFGGAVVDAPGFKEFEVVGIHKRELGHYFPEMRALLNQCHYDDCLHNTEPGCVVRLAAEEGRIAHHRYNVYLNILETMDEPQNHRKG